MTVTEARPAAVRGPGPAPSRAGSARSFQRRMAGALAVLVVVLAALAWASSSEPVRLTGVTPGDGSAVPRPPSEVALTFSGRLTVQSVFAQVSTADGSPVTGGSARVDGQRVIVPVSAAAQGTYLVVYRLALGEGHEVSGRTGFTVGPVPLVGASSDLADDADEAGAHDHGHAEGPWNGALLVLDAVLVVGAVLLMVHRPRRRAG
ncbi:copper resistance protein CopC [Kitasatospora sp. NBC_00240]|uniref:copper resistance CopC family protein n=1 Tax=Kitasatospora sp. NBC_00240 TaxID=2903567 RepID=UPI00225C1F92|nr:copper resistance CopC family protein [Kitasatospora sp. NBC_00240]MCX5207885.1 copper resistance protein CopC [Kitasatospora sp. NBC_00240]